MDRSILDVVEINEEKLIYRIENTVFSQNMLNTWKRNKKEFFEKYILDIFWSDDKSEDIMYQENMRFGREFHTMCQRVFLNVPTDNSGYAESIKKIINIKKSYEEKYGKNIEFYPEYNVTLNGKIQVIIDLVVFIYEHGKLSAIDIWDWKTEGKLINFNDAKSRMQTRVYMYVCKESFGADVDFSNIRMHYFQPHLDNNIIIDYSEDMYLRDREYIWGIIKEVENFDFKDLSFSDV